MHTYCLRHSGEPDRQDENGYYKMLEMCLEAATFSSCPKYGGW